MKAAVYERYGPPEVVEIREIDTPAPKDGEVLIRTHAASVSSADWRLRSLEFPLGFSLVARPMVGLRRPRQPVLGSELAGVIEAVGPRVQRWKPGDAVVAFRGVRLGCHAEFACMPEDGAIVAKPPRLDFARAAALCFGGTTALSFLRRAKLARGEKVLVNGASGTVGTAFVQIARHFGAEVTGVCSGANVELVRSLGAEHVFDYKREDFTRSGSIYDVIVDVAGTAPYPRCRDVLAKRGRLLVVLGGMKDMLRAPWVTLTTRRRVIAGPAEERADDVQTLAELATAGAFVPVIDRVFPFAQIVEAHRRVDTGRKTGSVVVEFEAGD